jgi:hypothetical protein
MRAMLILLAPVGGLVETHPTIWDILGVCSLVLSIIGTGVTIWQAKEALKASSKAKSYRDEIVSDRAKQSAMHLYYSAKSARQECLNIITPVNRGRPPRGVNFAKVVEELQRFVDGAREESFRLKDDTIRQCLRNLESYIKAYRVENDPEKRYSIADEIHGQLNRLIAQISEQTDQRI